MVYSNDVYSGMYTQVMYTQVIAIDPARPNYTTVGLFKIEAAVWITDSKATNLEQTAYMRALSIRTIRLITLVDDANAVYGSSPPIGVCNRYPGISPVNDDFVRFKNNHLVHVPSATERLFGQFLVILSPCLVRLQRYCSEIYNIHVTPILIILDSLQPVSINPFFLDQPFFLLGGGFFFS